MQLWTLLQGQLPGSVNGSCSVNPTIKTSTLLALQSSDPGASAPPWAANITEQVKNYGTSLNSTVLVVLVTPPSSDNNSTFWTKTAIIVASLLLLLLLICCCCCCCSLLRAATEGGRRRKKKTRWLQRTMITNLMNLMSL